MHYYSFNIGLYNTHSSHLSPIEDIIHRRLLDRYYLHEKPIVNDFKEIARLINLNECLTDVERVVNEFFVLYDDGWHNKHADELIETFQNTRERNSKAGKLSAKARKQKRKQSQQPINERSTTVQPTINYKLETNNYKLNNNPLGFKNDFDVLKFPHFSDPVFTNLYQDFLEARKRARKPATKIAQELILNKLHAYVVDEAKKMLETSIMNGWQGVFPLRANDKPMKAQQDVEKERMKSYLIGDYDD